MIDGYAKYSNNVPKGDKPKFIEGTEDVLAHNKTNGGNIREGGRDVSTTPKGGGGETPRTEVKETESSEPPKLN